MEQLGPALDLCEFQLEQTSTKQWAKGAEV